MSRVQNRVGFVRGVGLLTSGLVLGALIVPSLATAQLYGAGRNNGAVVVDEDVLGALGSGGARPGVSVTVLPAPPTPPRSKINQIPPQKVKAGPLPQAPSQVPSQPASEPLSQPPTAAQVAASAPPAPPQAVPIATPAVAVSGSTVPGPVVPGSIVPSPMINDKGVRILFLPDSADLSTTIRPALDGLLKLVQSQPDSRILITAHAAGTPETASQARRLSLNRALTLRSFLAEKGVSTARVDVRALGGQVADGPADRVDVELTAP
jgi:outer membrane protein OmpA-like peptidoglycan-associated protein